MRTHLRSCLHMLAATLLFTLVAPVPAYGCSREPTQPVQMAGAFSVKPTPRSRWTYALAALVLLCTVLGGRTLLVKD